MRTIAPLQAAGRGTRFTVEHEPSVPDTNADATTNVHKRTRDRREDVDITGVSVDDDLTLPTDHEYAASIV